MTMIITRHRVSSHVPAGICSICVFTPTLMEAHLIWTYTTYMWCSLLLYRQRSLSRALLLYSSPPFCCCSKLKWYPLCIFMDGMVSSPPPPHLYIYLYTYSIYLSLHLYHLSLCCTPSDIYERSPIYTLIFGEKKRPDPHDDLSSRG